MSKFFNTEGVCIPTENYMVNLESRLHQMKEQYVDKGKYFTINRARQYGKTTTLHALADFLRNEYVVIALDFQMLSSADFQKESAFVAALAREILTTIDRCETIPDNIRNELRRYCDDKGQNRKLAELFGCLSNWCAQSEKKLVLIIDEVDSATNNQVFLDFLSQLRGYYIHRQKRPTFQSVILAGVYDVKNLKQKLRPEDEHKYNSPWNIAADFNIDMSFSRLEIQEMLEEYEEDYHTGMCVNEIANMLYDYTSGYPYLVSRLCKIIDEVIVGSERFKERSVAWTKAGVLEAVKRLLAEKNVLFESLHNKLYDYEELYKIIYTILFQGRSVAFSMLNPAIELAVMFGIVKNENGNVVISNRIFETVFYNVFLTSTEVQGSDIYKTALQDKSQFIQNGHLDMERILEKFVLHFDELYGDSPSTFKEEDGRRFFLLYLRPIINGIGNYYIEARTRNMERTDLIVDYNGEQFVVEMKIWRGKSYHERGEQQLYDYLNHYHLNKGYMLSFNFNKDKKIGLKKIELGDKLLIEAVV